MAQGNWIRITPADNIPLHEGRAVKVGGESGHNGSRHFTDQMPRYASGALRTVYFWPEQLKGHTERTYRPGS